MGAVAKVREEIRLGISLDVMLRTGYSKQAAGSWEVRRCGIFSEELPGIETKVELFPY